MDDAELPPAADARPASILRQGRNFWRSARAARAAVLVDASCYFAALEAVLEKAERSITIVGWDFDADIRLCGEDGTDRPRLGAFLRALVESRPALEIRILVWNLSTLHAPGAALPLLLGAPWQDHPRIKLRLDGKHPVYGAQHQKIVAVDDTIAFVGGIDLTVRRWDTPEHLPDDPRRRDPEGIPYEAVHDAQMVVEGEAAALAGAIADERWQRVTGERRMSGALRGGALWPPHLEPDFADVPVALSRTIPRRGFRRGVREVGALTLDAIAAARRMLYIEAQYFADRRVGELIAAGLEREEGPEVVVVIPRSAHGMLEGWIMNGNRERVFRRLQRADRFGRFLPVYPTIAGPQGDTDIFVHAKLLVVDDSFLRVGSSNLNRRSTGLDLECDLAIEAEDRATEEAIAGIRARLLGEHLGVDARRVAATLAEEGSLVRTVQRLAIGRRRLRRYAVTADHGSTRLMFGTRLLDPRGPLRLASLFTRRHA